MTAAGASPASSRGFLRADDKITSSRDELFYWLTIVVPKPLGTALGDFTADATGLNLGFEKGGLLFAGLITVVAMLHRLNGSPRQCFSAAAYILTRPLGARLGDVLTESHGQGGLEFGRITATLLIAAPWWRSLSYRKTTSAIGEA